MEPTQETQSSWPDLPTEGFISGRAATVDDVGNGDAAFSMDGASQGPIDIEIPQYALWTNEVGEEVQVVVVQAERAPDGSQIVGMRLFDGGEVVGTMPEVELLGQTKPN
ncbi:hypothetical protein H6P80_07060 [Parasphingopyxis sp. GrpM-11]|uniref:Uncharacterized protein n=1 Tax=Parasphingopyxis marina TaxID=2761622 RepID=A0A842HY56_9SPHN|nr:hypothetical protein [Parasphingopyxis marina]